MRRSPPATFVCSSKVAEADLFGVRSCQSAKGGLRMCFQTLPSNFTKDAYLIGAKCENMLEDPNKQRAKKKKNGIIITHFITPFAGHEICMEALICYQVNYLCFRVAEAFTFPD